MITAREWLVKLRNENHLTHEQVASLSQIERSYYTKIENDERSPGVSVAKRIGAALGFSWTVFFEDESDGTSQTRTESA